jgi:signal peptidase
MVPTLHAGDLTVAVRHASYQAGDIIAFHVPAEAPSAGLQVIHRIAGGNGTTGFLTKGDANPVPDPWHPTNADVLGKVWLVVPGQLGWAIAITAAILLALLVIAAWPSKRKKPGLAVPAAPPYAAGVRPKPGAGAPGPPRTPPLATTVSLGKADKASVVDETSAPGSTSGYWRSASSPRVGGPAQSKRWFRSIKRRRSRH